jgi:hypothetical protein
LLAAARQGVESSIVLFNDSFINISFINISSNSWYEKKDAVASHTVAKKLVPRALDDAAERHNSPMTMDC